MILMAVLRKKLWRFDIPRTNLFVSEKVVD
jgi:hypothetical protein